MPRQTAINHINSEIGELDERLYEGAEILQTVRHVEKVLLLVRRMGLITETEMEQYFEDLANARTNAAERYERFR